MKSFQQGVHISPSFERCRSRFAARQLSISAFVSLVALLTAQLFPNNPPTTAHATDNAMPIRTQLSIFCRGANIFLGPIYMPRQTLRATTREHQDFFPLKQALSIA